MPPIWRLSCRPYAIVDAGVDAIVNEGVEMIRALDILTCQELWDEDIVEGLNACECSYPSISD